MFLKISQYPQETPALEFLFWKVAGLKVCYFIKKSRCSPMNIVKFLRLPILKNISERLFFDCLNDSLLHGPKVSRSRLYEGPSHRSRFFVFKSTSLVLNRIPTCAWKSKTNTFDKAIKFLHLLFLVVLDAFRSF